MTNLNVDRIKDQNATPGYVEIPACEKLADLAWNVPTREAIVEIGAYCGRSTGWLVWGAQRGRGAKVYSVDTWETRGLETWPEKRPGYINNYPKPETRQAYEDHLDGTGIRPHVTPICGWSVEQAAKWKSPKIGLLFHDASHFYDEVKADLEAWLPHMAKHSTIALHDAGNPTCGVYEAARDVLIDAGWDWDSHVLQRWPKSPNRRGLLIVRTKA